MKAKNFMIRFFIVVFALGNKLDTRTLIAILAKAFNTSKQRICGNLSYLQRTGFVIINSNKPYSTVTA